MVRLEYKSHADISVKTVNIIHSSFLGEDIIGIWNYELGASLMGQPPLSLQSLGPQPKVLSILKSILVDNDAAI